MDAEAKAAPGPASPAKGGLLGTVVRLVVSVAAIGVVLAYTDFGDAIAHARTQHVGWAALAGAALSAQVGLGALRWHWIRTGLGAAVRFANSAALYVIGAFFGAYVFSGLSGDVMRVFLSMRGGVDAGRATQSVVLDRVVVIAAIAVILVCASPWFLIRFGAVGWAPALAVVGFFCAIFGAAQLHRLPARLEHLLPVRLARALGEGVRNVFMRPQVAARAIFAAAAAQTAYAMAAWFLARSLGVEVDLIGCFVIMQMVAVASAVPISVGGWGVREASMVAGFALIGVPSSAALLLSVELGLLNLLVNMPGGLVWLIMRPEAGEARNAAPAALRPGQP